MTKRKRSKTIDRSHFTAEQLEAYNIVQARYKANRIKKRNDNLSRGHTTFTGNQQITELLDTVTYTVTTNDDAVSYVPVGNGLFERRILKQQTTITEYKLDAKTRKWIEITKELPDEV